MKNNIKTGNFKDIPVYLFHQGKNFEAYKFFGAHKVQEDSQFFHYFRVWAPNAANISVVGSFNNWNRESNPMYKVSDEIWEAKIPSLDQYDNYKYSIRTMSGKILLKSDPYSNHYETRPETASKIYDSDYTWNDDKWLSKKNSDVIYRGPINIYEVHFGSWKKNNNKDFFIMLRLQDMALLMISDI